MNTKQSTVKSALCALCITPTPKCWPVSLYCQRERYKVVENRRKRKCAELPHPDHEHLTDKSTLNTLGTYTADPNFDPTSRFQDIVNFILPHWLPCWKAKKEQNNVTNSTFKVEILPRSMHELGSDSGVYFRYVLRKIHSHMVPS